MEPWLIYGLLSQKTNTVKHTGFLRAVGMKPMDGRLSILT